MDDDHIHLARLDIAKHLLQALALAVLAGAVRVGIGEDVLRAVAAGVVFGVVGLGLHRVTRVARVKDRNARVNCPGFTAAHPTQDVLNGGEQLTQTGGGFEFKFIRQRHC